MDRYRDWFGVRFEFLLYDVTSTFFEGPAEGNTKSAQGYSRDSSPDRKQVCIGLVCGPEGPRHLKIPLTGLARILVFWPCSLSTELLDGVRAFV